MQSGNTPTNLMKKVYFLLLTGATRLYSLSVLDTKKMPCLDFLILNNVAGNIQNILPQQKTQISNLKEDTLSVISYF